MALLNQSPHPTALDKPLPNPLSPRSSSSDSASSEGHSSESADACAGQRPEDVCRSVKRRGICVDFLFGNCQRYRSRCRFHHPTPEEVAQDPEICRVLHTPGPVPGKEHPKAPGQPTGSTEAASNQELQNTVAMLEGLRLDPLDLLCQGAFDSANLHDVLRRVRREVALEWQTDLEDDGHR